MTKKNYPIEEAAQECHIEKHLLVHFIEEKWIVPIDLDSLDEEDLSRARLILDLQDIFGVNDAGIPIILHLVDQLITKDKTNELNPGSLRKL